MGNKQAKKNANSHLQTFQGIFSHYGMINFDANANLQSTTSNSSSSTMPMVPSIVTNLKEMLEGKHQIKLTPEMEDKICGWIIRNFKDLEK